MKYICLTLGWDGMPIAYQLQQEGYDVTVGQIQSKTEIGQKDDEESDDKESRLKQFDGMLNKVPAAKLVKALMKVPNKDDYFIYCDQNAIFDYAQQLRNAGFTKGNFPTKEDYDFEKNRDDAMTFVKKNYPDIKIIPFHEFKTVDEAKAFLDENDGVYVVQSMGDLVSTVVPTSDDPEAAKAQVVNQLDKNEKEYNQGGIILKEKLINPIEITPQIVFCDGEVVFTDLDLETKNIGDGQNNGNQVGCGTDLVIRTEMDDYINTVAFPDIVYQMAKEHDGIFIWDISIYIMGEDLYFGEFCSNRYGYDALMTEMAMAGGAGKFFEALVSHENPLEKQFGAAVRLFNLNRKAEVQMSYPDELQEHVWLYEVYEKDNIKLSLGDCWDLGVMTGAGDTVNEAIDEVYEHVEQFSFKELYTKSKTDFLDIYPTSIMFRFLETNGEYYDVPEAEVDHTKHGYQKKLALLNEKNESQMKQFKGKLKDLLNG